MCCNFCSILPARILCTFIHRENTIVTDNVNSRYLKWVFLKMIENAVKFPWLSFFNNCTVDSTSYVVIESKMHVKSCKMHVKSGKMHMKSGKMHVKSCKMHVKSCKMHVKSCQIHVKSLWEFKRRSYWRFTWLFLCV